MNSEADNIIGLYQRHAQDWDKDRGRSLFERPWLEQFLKLVPPGGSILDIGCGSSEPIARFLIEQGYEVTGVDSSPSLIDMCKRRFPLQKWVVADMRALRLDTIFNGIIAWDSFFHLRPEDQRLMFPRFRKHASAEAALLFTSGPAYGEAIGEYRGEPLYHGSLDGAAPRIAGTCGFAIVSHVVEDVTCGNHTIWLTQLR